MSMPPEKMMAMIQALRAGNPQGNSAMLGAPNEDVNVSPFKPQGAPLDEETAHAAGPAVGPSGYQANAYGAGENPQAMHVGNAGIPTDVVQPPAMPYQRLPDMDVSGSHPIQYLPNVDVSGHHSALGRTLARLFGHRS